MRLFKRRKKPVEHRLIRFYDYVKYAQTGETVLYFWECACGSYGCTDSEDGAIMQWQNHRLREDAGL